MTFSVSFLSTWAGPKSFSNLETSREETTKETVRSGHEGIEFNVGVDVVDVDLVVPCDVTFQEGRSYLSLQSKDG